MEKIDGIFKKMALLYKLFVLIAVAVVGKIVYLQFINPTDTKAVDIAYKEETIEAIRGDILARDGRPMATSVPYYQVRMDCTVSNQDTCGNFPFPDHNVFHVSVCFEFVCQNMIFSG